MSCTRVTALLVLAICATGATTVAAQSQGGSLFTQTCVACHTIGGGRLIGPDLANVHYRRDEAWIISFVQSSQALVASGDTAAASLVAAYSGMIMPDHPLTDDQVREILAHIALNSPAGNPPIVDEAVDPAEVTTAQVRRGQSLFVGRAPFENGGAACSSCHNVRTDDVMTGGSLAKDLTTAVTRLTRPGVEAMMKSPPFPAMRIAFEGKPLTEDEAAAISAFLQVTDEVHLSQEDRDYGRTLAGYGLAGVLVVLGLFSLLGIRNTKHTVNYHIYGRQIKTRKDRQIK
jgi:mono/diheme cytochrome c family protein